MFKFCALSDLHGNLIDNIEPCDVVLIAGDIFPLDIQTTTVKASEWLCQKFIPWAESLPCDKVVFIAGNHDFLFEKLSEYEIMDVLPPKIVYLEDEIYDYRGVKIFGIPWGTYCKKWAFYTEDESEFDDIPECDILISHQPPMIGSVGIVHQIGYNYMETFASENLANNIKRVKPKYSISGHVHTGNHIPEMIDETKYVNVSIIDEDYEIKYCPFYFDISNIKLKEEKPEDNNI
ncbi:MAG: metallophosphoesterase [Erysipelotrichales bacterium]|nr:metallophosphoesterase [Erysipelotrichales bacterium]